MDVTAIVPMHNSGELALHAVRSIAAQTRQPARVLVIDDASADESAEVVRSAGIPLVEVVELERNRGPGGARNAGAHAASTEWLAFLDADDVWEPTFLEEVLGAIERFDADFGAAGGVRDMVHANTIVRIVDGPREAMDLTEGFWRVARRFSPIVPSCAVIRRSAFMRVGGFPEDMRVGEDMVLFGRLWLDGRFAFVNKPLYRSGQRRGGLSAGPRSYHDTGLFTVRLGATLARALVRRKPGSRAFAITYARRVLRRHMTWLGRKIRRRR
jgi:glycosyltransferase involved in cell wall biosynthesis